MGTYTLFDSDALDAKIRQILDSVVKEICKAVNVRAIVLSGSFGRGEGTARVEDHDICLISDFEICVVSPHARTRQVCAALSKSMSDRLGVEISLSWLSPRRLVSNTRANATFGRDAPSIFMYELKAGSRLLHGDDVLQHNVLRPETLPLWEGLRLLLNRMAESLVEPPCRDTELYMAKWINKTLLACGDILLLDQKRYHYSYQERGRRLSAEVNSASYPFLDSTQWKDLIEAYDNKLRGTYDAYRECCLPRFHAAIDGVLRYAVLKDLGIEFSSYGEFPGRYLSRKTALRHRYAYRFYSLVHPLYANLIYALRLTKWGLAPSPWALAEMGIAWHHVIYSAIPPLYFERTIAIKEKAMVMDHVGHILALFRRPAVEDLSMAKRRVTELWFNVCYGRNTVP